MAKKPKKTAVLRARVPENIGQAVSSLAESNGKTTSAILREAVEEYMFRNTPGRRLGRAFEALGNLSDIRQALGPDARLDSLTYERLTLPAVQVLMNVAEPVNRAALAAYQAFEAGPADGAPGSLKIARRPVRKSHLAKAAEALAEHRRALESLEDIAASSPLDSEAIRTAVERIEHSHQSLARLGADAASLIDDARTTARVEAVRERISAAQAEAETA